MKIKLALIATLISIASPPTRPMQSLKDESTDEKYPHIKVQGAKSPLSKNAPDDGRPTIKISVIPSDSDKLAALYFINNRGFRRKFGKMVNEFESKLCDRDFFHNKDVEECAKVLMTVEVLRKELGMREKNIWTTTFSLSDRIEAAFNLLKKFVPEPKD